MSIYYQRYRPILELKRSVNGVEQDLDEEEQNTPNDYTNTDEQDNEPLEDQNNDPNGKQENPEEDNNEDEAPEEDTTEDETPEEDTTEDEHADDDTEANDYNSDLNDEEPGDEPAEDNTTDEEETTGSTDMSEGEIKQMEQELFKSVPAEQMAIKVLELKKQYLEAYNTISNILIRVNKITKTTDNMKVLEFVTNKLLELKELIKFYMTNTFDTKSFIENNINYQQYLSTLNTINKIFKEIKDKNEDK